MFSQDWEHWVRGCCLLKGIGGGRAGGGVAWHSCLTFSLNDKIKCIWIEFHHLRASMLVLEWFISGNNSKMGGIGMGKREMFLEIKWFDIFIFSCENFQNIANFAKTRLDSPYFISCSNSNSWHQNALCTTLWFIEPKEVAYSISEIHSALNLQHVSTLRAFRRNCLEKALQGTCPNDAVLKNTPDHLWGSTNLPPAFCFLSWSPRFLQSSGLVSKAEFMIGSCLRNNCILSNSLVGFQFLTRRTK